jgi:hypothetical protein
MTLTEDPELIKRLKEKRDIDLSQDFIEMRSKHLSEVKPVKLVKIESISIMSDGFTGSEVMFRWNNDRYQAIKLDGRDSESVIKALLEAVNFLRKEQKAGEI